MTAKWMRFQLYWFIQRDLKMRRDDRELAQTIERLWALSTLAGSVVYVIKRFVDVFTRIGAGMRYIITGEFEE